MPSCTAAFTVDQKDLLGCVCVCVRCALCFVCVGGRPQCDRASSDLPGEQACKTCTDVLAALRVRWWRQWVWLPGCDQGCHRGRGSLQRTARCGYIVPASSSTKCVDISVAPNRLNQWNNSFWDEKTPPLTPCMRHLHLILHLISCDT